MLTRREFIKWSAAAGTWMYVSATGATKFLERAFAAIPGGTLDPLGIPKYATPMLIPPVMPKAGTIKQSKGAKTGDYYEISMRQFSQQILPAGLPATTVWGYGAVTAANKHGLRIHNAPSLTIEARVDRPVRVKWINELVDSNGDYLPHLLPVDPSLHWANPPGGMDARDSRPTFTETPGSYTGPVPICTHVHGAVGVHDDSDGYAEAWYLPAADNIPDDYATEGTWYEFFSEKASDAYGVKWGPGFATFQYPNHNRASTIWYHDHTLGMTRTNVYAGPAGFYIIRGGADDVVRDSRNRGRAVLPGPAPQANDKFPSNKQYYEIPIAIQDRAFNADGSLFYPDSREFFDGATATLPGFLPDTDLSPIWNPEFFGNTIMVNGNTWPFQTVEKRRYRFRFLNGCQSRFLILDFKNIPGVEVWQIGNEGGFLAAPVNLTELNGGELLMGLAERADLIVDFAKVPVGNYVLGNLGPDEPFGGGVPGVDFPVADADSTGQIMEFRVVPARRPDRTKVPVGNYVLGNLGPDEPFGGGVPGVDFPVADADSTGQIMEFRVVPARRPDRTTPPRFMTLPAIAPLPEEVTTRPLALLEMMSMYWDGPSEAMLGVVDEETGMAMHKMWMEPVTENPEVGDTEVWEFYNATADAHPMHVHEVVFEVVNREALVLDDLTGEVAQPIGLTGTIRLPEPWEVGLKDTVIAYPGEVTRIRARFTNPGQFVWHCHIVEHEDNEMMRPFRIGPLQPGQPGGDM